jgi:transcriptional regulator with XRE-family HTH domain
VPKQKKPDPELLANLGKNTLRYIRLRGYETAEQFCWQNGIPKSTLSRVTRGKGSVRLSNVVEIAKALNVKIDTLIKPAKAK